MPAVVIFADYTCRTLCGPILEFTAAGLGKTGLQPGIDYRLVVIGLDPRDGIDTHERCARNTSTPAARSQRAAVFLTGDDAGHSRRDPSRRAALRLRSPSTTNTPIRRRPMSSTPSGRVRRVLSPLGLDGGDLRLALVDAGQGAVGTSGRPHPSALLRLRSGAAASTPSASPPCSTFAAGATLVVMAGGIFAMVARATAEGVPS